MDDFIIPQAYSNIFLLNIPTLPRDKINKKSFYFYSLKNKNPLSYIYTMLNNGFLTSYIDSNACLKSSIISFISSIPIDTLIKSGVTPLAICSSSDN